MAHTRRDNVKVSVDDVGEWKRYMENEHVAGLEAFDKARAAIVRRRRRLQRLAALNLSIAYKNGDPFPAHFVWAGKGYTLVEPEVLSKTTAKNRKNKGYLQGVFESMDHEWDRFATLIIGLTTAQKIVTHWSEVKEDDDD